VVVDVVLALGVGLGGAGAPVVSMCPANTETASARLRIAATHIWRKVFIFFAPKRVCKIFASANETSMIGLKVPCKARTDYVRFAFRSLSFHSVAKLYDLTCLTTARTRQSEP
jgi:hypothetical protein